MHAVRWNLAESFLLHYAPFLCEGHESGSSGTTTPQETAASVEASPESRPPNLQDSLAITANDDATGHTVRSCARTAATSGREKADELIMVSLRWLSTIESFCPQTPEARALLPSAAVSKVQSLLTGSPPTWIPGGTSVQKASVRRPASLQERSSNHANDL